MIFHPPTARELLLIMLASSAPGFLLMAYIAYEEADKCYAALLWVQAHIAFMVRSARGVLWTAVRSVIPAGLFLGRGSAESGYEEAPSYDLEAASNDAPSKGAAVPGKGTAASTKDAVAPDHGTTAAGRKAEEAKVAEKMAG